ncbi:TlpA disulfide reductase family protein [Pollutibacter soli]|uniref:TlpA family protein disulfide reductase n=1 Tax=Pollutibacter soli TaxID=3034157 RepID=UPI0030135879
MPLLRIICPLFLFPVSVSVSAQSFAPPPESPGGYFNKFQNFVYNEPNSDSAYYYAHRLASNPKYLSYLDDLIHKNFAQSFIEYPVQESKNPDSVRRRSEFYKTILKHLRTDTSAMMQQTIRPMSLWIAAQDNRKNTPELRKIVKDFAESQLIGDLYANSAGRYGLLISSILSENPEMKPENEKLFSEIYSKLEKGQVVLSDTAQSADLERRAWYRFLFAYVNNLKANQAIIPAEKEKYLKEAFNYSPDLVDRRVYSAYFYDMMFLYKGEEISGFKTEYVDYLLSSSSDHQKTLDLFLEASLIEPAYKEKLRDYYTKINMSSTGFNQYWQNAIDAKANAPVNVSIRQLDKTVFSTMQQHGKWVLIDFWGTWCLPCRAEHPQLQKFYDSLVLLNPSKISLLTVACKDTEAKVSSYMKEKRYSFTVAMSDGKIEYTYPVEGYPTKILITPAGKFLTIPYGIDWVSFIKQYANL